MSPRVRYLRQSRRLKAFSLALLLTIAGFLGGLLAAAAGIALDRFGKESLALAVVWLAAYALLASVAGGLVASVLRWNVSCDACGGPVLGGHGRPAPAPLAWPRTVLSPVLGRPIACRSCGEAFGTKEPRRLR